MSSLLQPRVESVPQTVERADSTFASRTLTVATDGSAASAAALRVSVPVAARLGAVPTVVSVIPRINANATPAVPIPAAMIDDQYVWNRRKQIAEQVRRAGGGAEWPLLILEGDPATGIAERAVSGRAPFVVMGLRQHGTLDRIFRDETTLRVMRTPGVAVLGVVDSLQTLPKRIVAAVDFSRASLDAVRVAASIAAPGAKIFLVCVQPRARADSEVLEGRNVIMAQGIAGAFSRLQRMLDAESMDVAYEAVLLEGDAAPELITFAERVGADLIAIGSHRRSMVDRVLVGSVTSAVVRDGGCSVLTVRPAPNT